MNLPDHIRKLLLFLAPLILLAGCRPDDEDLIISIQPEFSVQAREALGPSPRQVELIISSLQTQPCDQTTLQTDWQQTGDGGQLTIKGYSIPQPCILNPEIISTSRKLPWMQAGAYPVSINLSNRFYNPAQILIDNAKVSILPFSQNGLQMITEDILRLPDGIAWGRLTGTNESAGTDILEFLANWPGESSLPQPGNYGHFLWMEQGQIILAYPTNQTSSGTVDFLRKGLDPVAFAQAMTNLIHQSNGSISGVLFHSEGVLIP